MADRGRQVVIPAPVAELVAAWEARSADRFVAVLAPEVQVVVPPLHLELDGRDDAWMGVARLFGAFGALRYTSRHRYLTADSVTDEALLEGLQTQEFLGAPPPGHPGGVAARVIMHHDGFVITRLEVWPDVGALRDLSDGVARRIDLRTAGAAAPVVAALRATIPSPEGKLSLGHERPQAAGLVVQGTLLPGAPDVDELFPGTPAGHGTPSAAATGQEPARGRPKGEVPKAPLPRKVRRLRAFLAGVAMLAVAGLLVAYVVQGVRTKQVAAAPSRPRPTASAARSPAAEPSRSPSSSPTASATFNEKTNSYTFSASLLFRINSATLLPNARSILGRVIEKVLSDKRYGTVRVLGYTDNTGSEQLNRNLSQRRADAVARYLRERLPRSHFTLAPVGKGETAFVAPNDNEADRAKNRRVQITVPLPSS